MEKIVIVGGVAAGATAAAKARRISPDAKITMLEAGPDVSFANCGLPYYIGGDIKERSKLILQSPESFKQQYDVDVYTNTIVLSINKEEKSVLTENTQTGKTETFEYTKLILAQGGRPIKPELPGSDSNHVFSLWTLSDMDKITKHLEEKNPKSAVVVGGGFIGLEMVEALAKRGLKVSVVELAPHVMSLMEAETAGFIEREMVEYGVGVYTGVGVNEVKQGSVLLSNGDELPADMVIMSIGVRPTLQLAKDTGLELGEAGGLLVDEYMQTSDENIYAAGDMVEIEHRVNNKKVRIPLAGPANRQGRIAAENALGGKHSYKGALGTSVVRVFEAVAGITGLSLKQAKALGYNADAVVVHKEHHTGYYPGATNVTVMLIFDKDTGVVLGGQTAGYKGADKRLDVIATATASKLTVAELADIDFAYSPPIGTANDAMNMAAFTAENKISGFSNSITASQLDDYLAGKSPYFLDIRNVFDFEKAHIEGAVNVPLELLSENLSELPKDRLIVIYDETGKKGHQALRTLIGAGFEQVVNVSGGHISLQRHALAVGFNSIDVILLPFEEKSLSEEQPQSEEQSVKEEIKTDGPLIVDVRSDMEFAGGAYPGAVNIPLDELEFRSNEFGDDKTREIIVYCASGARSSYAQQYLKRLGYQNVENGGGLNQMMMNRKVQNSEKPKDDSTPLIIDVRTEGEFASGAYPNAMNIPVDSLQHRLAELGSNKNREIVVYCASGARSAYAQQMLQHFGFINVENGGGLMHMMARAKVSV